MDETGLVELFEKNVTLKTLYGGFRMKSIFCTYNLYIPEQFFLRIYTNALKIVMPKNGAVGKAKIQITTKPGCWVLIQNLRIDFSGKALNRY